ncbi:hypothetical protein VTH82DRAFT_7407 [Thermothelomyces myriococcoides]
MSHGIGQPYGTGAPALHLEDWANQRRAKSPSNETAKLNWTPSAVLRPHAQYDKTPSAIEGPMCDEADRFFYNNE